MLADDNAALIAAVRRAIERHFRVVGAVSDGVALIQEAKRLEPDIVVADISMPLMSGIEAVRRLIKENVPVKVIFLTIHSEPGIVEDALSTGALGYVVKSSADHELVPAIRAVAAGERFISPAVHY